MSKSIVKSVDRAEFEKQRKESLNVKPCPYCDGKIQLIMKLPFFEAKTVSFQCCSCNYSFEKKIPTEFYTSGNSLGSFVTAERIGKDIISLVNMWNLQAKEIINDRTIPKKVAKINYIYSEIN